MQRVKIIGFLAKFLATILLFCSFIMGPMLYKSKSGEWHARKTCDQIELNQIFQNRKIFEKPPFLSGEGSNVTYSYIFPMSFDTAAECKISVDEKNIAVKKEIHIY